MIDFHSLDAKNRHEVERWRSGNIKPDHPHEMRVSDFYSATPVV